MEKENRKREAEELQKRAEAQRSEEEQRQMENERQQREKEELQKRAEDQKREEAQRQRKAAAGKRGVAEEG